MVDISFCTTAMSRPKVLEKTYYSFSSNLKDIDLSSLTLYLNVDPLPDPSSRKKAIKVAKQFFNKVIPREPSVPNFTRAVNWCWESASTEYIFHLEDDWVLKRDISFRTMIDYFNNPVVKQVALRAYPYRYKKLCLSPSIIHKSIYKKFAGNFNFKVNPEVQLRKPDVHKRMIICLPKRVILKDIGREWLKKSDFRKKSNKASFNKWVKK